MDKKIELFEAFIESGFSFDQATKICQEIYLAIEELPSQISWQTITKNLSNKSLTFALYQLLYQIVYPNWRKTAAPAWFPDDTLIKNTNLIKLMQKINFKDFADFHNWSITNYSDFWALMTEELPIVLDKKYTDIVDLSQGIEAPNWLVGGKLNISKSCFKTDRSKIAILYQDHIQLKKMTYGELDQLSNRVANSLNSCLKVGDRVGMIMSMTPEAVAIYLGIIKAGCCVVPIAESFSTNEIGTRLKIAQVKMLFTQNTMRRDGKTLPIYEKLLLIENLPKVVVLNRQQVSANISRPQDIQWTDFLSTKTTFDAISCKPQDYTTILFSSGTTGDPKAIPWTHTTPIKCASDAYFHQNIQTGDVLCWPTSLGWMMGPWLVYAALINNATLALYDDVPMGKRFGEFVQAAKVTMLGVVPTLVKTWRNLRCMEGLDWTSIKLFSSTGECSNIEDMLYLMWLGHYRPIIEYCGGTEIGGAYITSTLIQPCAPAAFNSKAMGSDFLILNEKGNEADKGEVALIPPCIGLSTELLNEDHHAIYYAGMAKSPKNRVLRRHGDAIERLQNGSYRLQGRIDDTMNISGIKVCSTEIERALMSVMEIKETAAIGVNPTNGGPTQLVIYVVLHHVESTEIEQLKMQMQQAIKQFLNPLFKIENVILVDALPKTVSNKIMRGVLKDDYRKYLET